jgi:SlyX protein
MDDAALENLEVKIAYLERAATELSDVVFRQQQDIEALTLRLETLQNRVAAAAEEPRPPPSDEKPPHY